MDDVMNDKIYIREFTKKILEAVNIHAKTAMETNNELLRKVAKLIKLKNISLFETFLYMDVNATTHLSKLELNVGLKNLDIPLSEVDFELLWKAFDKSK